MAIKTNSWHYRWYVYWLEHSRGNKPGYRENLCHYMRVLVFWAPMAWVAERSPTRLLGRLCAAFTLAYAVAVVLGLVALLIYAAIFEPIILAIVIGSLIGALVLLFVGAVVVFSVLEGRKPEIPGTIKLLASYIVAKKRRICPFITFAEA